MNDKIPIPHISEPDPLDELAKWLDVVFRVCRPVPASELPLPLHYSAVKPPAVFAAEQDLLRWETIKQGQAILCRSPARCGHHRCRRRRRCTRLEVVAAGLAVAGARLAAERAKWQLPPSSTEPPPTADSASGGHGKGRTGVRP